MSNNILYFLADCAVADFYGTRPFYRNPPNYGYDFKMDAFRYSVNCCFARVMYLKKMNCELEDIDLDDVADVAHCGWRMSFMHWRDKLPESHRAFMDTRNIKYHELPQEAKPRYRLIARAILDYVYRPEI